MALTFELAGVKVGCGIVRNAGVRLKQGTNDAKTAGISLLQSGVRNSKYQVETGESFNLQ